MGERLSANVATVPSTSYQALFAMLEWTRFMMNPEKMAGMSNDEVGVKINADASTKGASDITSLQGLDDFAGLQEEYTLNDDFWEGAPQTSDDARMLYTRLTRHAIGKKAALVLLFDNGRSCSIVAQVGQDFALINAGENMRWSVTRPLSSISEYVKTLCNGGSFRGFVMTRREEKKRKLATEDDVQSKLVIPLLASVEDGVVVHDVDQEPVATASIPVTERAAVTQEEGEAEESSLASMMSRPRRRPRRQPK